MMREYGLTYSKFWVNPDIQPLPIATKAIINYCFSSPHTTSLGCFRLPIYYAAGDLNITQEEMLSGLQQAEKAKLLYMDYKNAWIWIPSFLKWNKIHNHNQWKYIRKLFDEAPKTIKYYPDLIQSILTHITIISAEERKDLETLMQSQSNHEGNTDEGLETLLKPLRKGLETPLKPFQKGLETLAKPISMSPASNNHCVETPLPVTMPQINDTTGSNTTTTPTKNKKTNENNDLETLQEPFRKGSETLLKPLPKPFLNQEQEQEQDQEQDQEQEQDQGDHPDLVAPTRPAGSRLFLTNQETTKPKHPPPARGQSPPRPALVRQVFAHWQHTMNHPQAKLDDKRHRLITRTLKSGYSVTQICEAISGCAVTPHNIGDNDQGQRYDGLHVILRDGDQIDRFIHNCRYPPKPQSAADRKINANVHNLEHWVAKKMSEEET